MTKTIATIVLSSLLFLSCNAYPEKPTLTDDEILNTLRPLLYGEENADRESLSTLSENWEEGMIAPLVEIMRFSTDPRQTYDINELLRRKTGESHDSFFGWMRWLWETKKDLEPYYYNFKADIYKNIDPKFHKYFFDREGEANIRLEEIVWGGVYQDGIPPLRNPKLLNPDEADYLSDTDIVFGAYINGVAKAYPKRILAWHEMFVDEFGDDLICGVYCTLCGTVIAYDTKHAGVVHDLGTSGFLYRSNKLMYDQATQSLWNTIEGKPVLGPLYDKGIELSVRPIVTTTWGEWKRTHPTTKVLSLDTGHNRNYDEGEAYKNYFSTDELMFPVPVLDNKLNNKDEVLIIRSEEYRTAPLAISIKYLKKKKWNQGEIAGTNYLVLSDDSGAARVYDRGEHSFKSFNNRTLKDNDDQIWKVSHDKITSPSGEILERLPSHNTFWFAWYNTYPKTKLIK